MKTHRDCDVQCVCTGGRADASMTLRVHDIIWKMIL